MSYAPFGSSPPAPSVSPSPLPSPSPVSVAPVSAPAVIRLSPAARIARDHAVLASIAWLIILPLGVLVARYLRTFTRKWFWGHAVIQLVIAAPIFYAGWARGYRFADFAGLHFFDTHTKIGLAMLVLYTIQLVLGLFIHYIKFPALMARIPGGRTPQNYLHVALGIALLALGTFQVHYGLYVEWPRTFGGAYPVPQSAKNAWLALIIIFWSLFVLGFGLLPRQLKQESAARKEMRSKEMSMLNDA